MARPNAYESPAGLADHPWINKPDTKYNANGVFKTGLYLDGSEVETQNLLALIDEQAEAQFKEQTKGLSAAELKKWKVYKPYEEELDDETGEPTGRVMVTFKRNYKITVNGEDKYLRVSIYDADGNVPPEDDEPAIFGGSTLQVAFTFRPVKVPGTKQAGVKLDMFAVRVIKLKRGGGGFQWSGSVPDADEGGGERYVYKPKAERQAAPKKDSADEGEGESEY